MYLVIVYICAVCCSLMVHLAAGAFDEAPASLEVSIGAEAVFRCRHPTADTIRWIVNGSLVGRDSPPDITPSTTRDGNGNLVDTLTITAQQEYNGTVLVCVARFDDGRVYEQTQPALLLVSMNSTIVYNGRFLVSPASQTVVAYEVATFHCQHTTADGIFWNINGLPQSEFPYAVIQSSGALSSLTIMSCPEYNQTVVQCRAVFNYDIRHQQTASALIVIQGNLSHVTELQRISSTLTWVPPFTLNLTGVDPDIVYCVEVFNITCRRRDLIVSDCSATEPSYTSDDIAPHGYIYEYIVTPRSNVLGARNGIPSQPLREQFSRLTVLSTLVSITTGNSNMCYQTMLSLKSESDLPVPSAYTLSLVSLDGLEDIDSVEMNTTRTGSLITFNIVPGLPPNRLWNGTVLAYGCQEHPILSDVEQSTHDIQNISVSSPLPGQIRVTGDFIQGSTATGALVIVYNSLSDDSAVHYHSSEHDGQSTEITVDGLTDGEYGVSIFVMVNGLPFSRVAALPQMLYTNTTQQRTPQQRTIEYEIQANLTCVCITCTFMDSSTTDCVAVVHQRISQLSSSGLMNIELSHKLNRSGTTAYGCIEGEKLSDHQVGVIGGSQRFAMASSKTSLCNMWCIIGIVLGIAAGMSLTVAISSFCLYIAIKRVTAASSINSIPEVTVDMKVCAAYEVTTLAKQKVVMKTNPSYEQIRIK